uniref:Uncharacterized protein n=1 Tax=Oryza meridionalis TaxID=40149 RepID=A0A0E0E9T8_9ORYZ
MVMFGSLLHQAEKLLEYGILPIRIVEGYEMASRIVFDYLEHISQKNLIRKNSVVYGGGSAQISCSIAVKTAADQQPGVDQGSGIITDKQNEDQYTSGKQFSWFMQAGKP